MSTLLTVLLLAGHAMQPAPVVPLPQDVNRFATVTILPPPEHHHHEPVWSVWDALAECESNGDWHTNTGNGYYGGLQFALASWRAVGGTGYPHEHPREEQIVRAERLLTLQGWGAWPACSRKIGLR